MKRKVGVIALLVALLLSGLAPGLFAAAPAREPAQGEAARLHLPLVTNPLPPSTSGTTTRVSVSSEGIQGNLSSHNSEISADGRFVSFWSEASTLVAGDSNGYPDSFVHDRQTGQTTRVSVDSAGAQGNRGSYETAISADGRFVAFSSNASNLVAGDSNEVADMFVHDRQTGQTTRVSVDSAGAQANRDSYSLAISADGRFVTFGSWASNLVAGDSNGESDIFVHDRQTGQTTRVSVDSSGAQGIEGSLSPTISADGHFVTFWSAANNLVAGDSNGEMDIFVHDRQTGQTTRVSVDSAGAQGNLASWSPAISGNGRLVTFVSYASNLVAGDTNGKSDVFVHDRQSGETTLVSVDSAGAQGNFDSNMSAISADGRVVAFESQASNFVAGDSNGQTDIFVHDRQTGQTTRVSVDSSGAQGSCDFWGCESHDAALSADGRVVTFASGFGTLVVGDTNSAVDVFVHDRGSETQ